MLKSGVGNFHKIPLAKDLSLSNTKQALFQWALVLSLYKRQWVSTNI